MEMYERYVDDSNQIAIVPPVGSRYDPITQKIVKENFLVEQNETEETRLARVLKTIANSVQDGIVMEEDSPERHQNLKMGVLDMECWLDENGYALYKHYEKPVASTLLVKANSAQSENCKRNVHVQEILRRILNCSPRLDWEEQIAPVLTNYMSRMMAAGYSEVYRKQILKHALGIYTKMKERDLSGIRPLYRPKDWQLDERRQQKKKKKHTWSTKGGYVAPIFVPPTPNGELAKQLRSIAEYEAEEGIKFKIIETGGRTIKGEVQQSNPTSTKGCNDTRCLACKDGPGQGGNCRRSNVEYQFECQMCPPNNKAVYLGETSRNLFTRAIEHDTNYRKGKQTSFMFKHQANTHNGAEANFKAKVTSSHNDCLTRQVSEGVNIRRCEVEVLNMKTEWHQPPLWRVQSEIYRG